MEGEDATATGRKGLPGVVGPVPPRRAGARLAAAGPGRSTAIVCITRGGLVPAAIISRELGIRVIETVCVASYHDYTPRAKLGAEGDRRGRREGGGEGGTGILIVDDLVDTGKTAAIVREMLPKAHFATVYAKPQGPAAGRHLRHRGVAGHLDLFPLGHGLFVPAADREGSSGVGLSEPPLRASPALVLRQDPSADRIAAGVADKVNRHCGDDGDSDSKEDQSSHLGIHRFGALACSA